MEPLIKKGYVKLLNKDNLTSDNLKSFKPARFNDDYFYA